MKKITMMLILLIITLGTISVHADFEEALYDLGYISKNISIEENDKHITKRELAYTLAKIMGAGVLEPCDTAFSDVTKDDEYSAYIQYVVDLGYFEKSDKFEPDNVVSASYAADFYIDIAGYSNIKESNGINKTASLINLSDGVNMSETLLSKKSFLKLTENLFLLSPQSSDNGKTVFSDDESFMGKTLGISVYEGALTDISESNAKVSISKNVYKGNHELLNAGSLVNYQIGKSVNAYNYENAPSVIWVSNDEIKYIALKNNVEIMYNYIASVNGDGNEDAAYSSSLIDRLKLYNDDKKYNTGSNLIVKYNNEITDNPVILNGNFAKLVFENSKVIYIECWDFIEAGILTGISDTNLIYTQGENTGKKILKYDEFSTKRLFIDGRSADIKELKLNSVIEYFTYKDIIFINSSERTAVDILKSKAVNEDEISIGNLSYNLGDNIYSSLDGKEYKDGINSILFGKLVKAYFAPNGDCRYISVYNEELDDPRFYGAVISVISEEDLSVSPEDISLSLWRITPNIEMVTYKLNKRCIFNDGLDINALKNTKKTSDGVFVFRINRLGDICEISKPNGIYGLNGGSAVSECSFVPSTFIDNADANFVYSNKRVYTGNAPFVTLSNDAINGFVVRSIGWGQLKGRNNSSTVKIFGSEDGLDAELVVICGNVTLWQERYTQYGVITDVSKCVDDDDEYYYNIEVLSQGGKKTFKLYDENLVSGVDFDNITKPALITYGSGRVTTMSDFAIYSFVPLNNTPEQWDETLAFKGVVKKATNEYILFTNDERYYVNPGFSFVAERLDNNDYEMAKMTDIQPGDTVYANLTTQSEIRGLVFTH